VDDDITGNKGICHEVQQANQQHVTDGIEAVNNALKLWPDDRDAAALMSLLYRRKADIGCGDANRRAEDLRAADELVKRNGESLKANPGKLGCMSFLRPLPFGDRQHGLNSAAKAPQRIFLKTNVMPRNSLIKKVALATQRLRARLTYKAQLFCGLRLVRTGQFKVSAR
jgi:hypothetical protein